MELCILLRVGGLFIAMKGAEGTQEMEESGRALRELGSSIAEVVNLELPRNGRPHIDSNQERRTHKEVLSEASRNSF